MPITRRRIAGCALILAALAVPHAVRAQGVAVATLQVGVRVVRSCSVSADSSAAEATTSSVRVVCARSTLRAMRVSTADAVEAVSPLLETAGAQRLAGREIIITVPVAVLVTLHF